jgi:hypothetical protein
MKLTVELVPATSWGNNLRSEANLSKSDWDTLRKESYRLAKYRCQICGGKGPKHPVECHEIWHYDDHTLTQTLKGLISLCPKCHQVKHLGRSLSMGNLEALEHLAQVNQMNPEQLTQYVEQVFQTHAERSQHQWKLDLYWLDSRLKPQPDGFFDLDLT